MVGLTPKIAPKWEKVRDRILWEIFPQLFMSFFFLMNNEIIIILYLSSLLLWLFRDDETNNLKCRNITWLKISTGRRRTSWLFYKRGRGFEIGTTKNKFLPTGDCWVCRSLYPDLTLATPLNMIFFPFPRALRAGGTPTPWCCKRKWMSNLFHF